MSPESRRRIAFSVAALVVIAVWRPLRAAIETDALFFAAALGVILLAGKLASLVGR